jgi:L-alanine-DL-glutamate epimerase-like enolase superfamily enzyme
MQPMRIESLNLEVRIEHWPLAAPFRIAGHDFDHIDIVVVSLEKDGRIGRGEAAGVYYRNDTPVSMIKQIESLRTTIERGISRDSVQALMPAGGARNALDCALWDLEAKVSGCDAWQLAGLETVKPLLTTFTCGADSPENMAIRATHYRTDLNAQAIKLKLTGEMADSERVRAVRESLPDVWLGIDANQGFTLAFLDRLMPALTEARVGLIEQPLPVGQEWLLEGYRSPIPIAADESAQTLADLPALVGRYDVMNIKLDKCGGLTEGIAMARRAREYGLDTMVGNMLGTSLAMAPAFLVGQLCQVVDLDGPVFQKTDRPNRVEYVDGFITCPKNLWGNRV